MEKIKINIDNEIVTQFRDAFETCVEAGHVMFIQDENKGQNTSDFIIIYESDLDIFYLGYGFGIAYDYSQRLKGK